MGIKDSRIIKFIFVSKEQGDTYIALLLLLNMKNYDFSTISQKRAVSTEIV